MKVIGTQWFALIAISLGGKWPLWAFIAYSGFFNYHSLLGMEQHIDGRPVGIKRERQLLLTGLQSRALEGVVFYIKRSRVVNVLEVSNGSTEGES